MWDASYGAIKIQDLIKPLTSLSSVYVCECLFLYLGLHGRVQKLWVPLQRAQRYPSVKPGAGQNIALCAFPAAQTMPTFSLHSNKKYRESETKVTASARIEVKTCKKILCFS